MVPLPPSVAVTLGCSVGGGHSGLVPSMSPAQVEPTAWMNISVLVNCAWLPPPMPSMLPLNPDQLAPRPRSSVATSAYWLGCPFGTQLSCATIVMVPLVLMYPATLPA